MTVVAALCGAALAEDALHGIVLVVVGAALAETEHELGIVLEGDGHAAAFVMIHAVDAVQVHAHAQIEAVRGTTQRHGVRSEGEVGFE